MPLRLNMVLAKILRSNRAGRHRIAGEEPEGPDWPEGPAPETPAAPAEVTESAG
jgi:hypothetical protein